MKAAVLHVNSSGREATSPTMRIARFVADELGVPFIHDRTTAQASRTAKFDVLFVKYGMLKFSDHRDEALQIHENARKVVNLENDYTFVPDKRFKKADECWSTVEGKTRYVNWNVITRWPLERWRNPAPLPAPMYPGVIYYGAHRPDREKDFAKYFRDAPYPVSISSFRGRREFERSCGKKVSFVGTFNRDNHRDDPAQWPLTIYMEDETSHRLYCSPATRFYECTMMGLAQVIDKAAVPTLERAGMKIRAEFIVNGQRGVKKALGYYKDLQAAQRELWYHDYGADLREQLHDACKKSFGTPYFS